MLLLSKQTLKKLFKVGSSLLLVALVSTLITTVLSPSANAANYPDKDFCEKYGGTWTENRGDDGRVISYTCNGAPSRLVEKMSPTEELTSFSLYTGIADCIGTRMYGDIQASATDNSNVAPSKWFNYGTFISIGDLYKTADVYPQGEKKCDAMVTQALDMWGYGDDYSRFLRDMGYTFNRDTLNWHGSADGGTRYREFQDILKSQVYPSISGSVPALSKAAQYLENLYFFQKSLKDGGCAAYDLGEYPDLGGVSAYKRWVDQNYVTYNDGAAAISAIGEKNAYIKYSKIQIIGTDRKSTPHGFAFYFGPTQNDSILIDFFAVESSRIERGETCDQIAKNVSNFSTDYFGWLALNPESQVDGGGNACTQGAGGPNCPDEPATSCVIDGIGWIVCPVLNAIGGVSDAMYGWISSILLLNPLQMNDESGNPTPQYTGWKTIRDISNVLLVIAFLIIIFSQITSIGVTNYGIKKLLPRVILVAVLVNVSFLVMMITIDVVNLIGTSLYNILVGLAPDVTGTSIAADNAIGSFVTGIVTGSLVGAGVTIAGGLIGAPALALLAVPFIIVAVLALFAAIATLFVRNALVIILVLLAPLAFAAFLLPNTKSLFDRWRKLTVGILFLYPTAALLFGGTKFAAYTLANDDQPLSILVAVFVMAAPLGLLPWLAASSGGILGTIGGRLQGLAKSARSPLQRAFKSRVDNQRERYQSGQNTLFGRRRSQAEFDQRQIDTATGRRRRNWGERLNQARTSRDTDTANAKTAQQANVAERGLRGTSRRDQQMGDIQRESLRLADQKASQGAEYRQQVDRMIATPGTVDAQREARKFDAEKASEGYNTTTKLRNQQRIIDNVASTAAGVGQNLGDQDQATYDTKKELEATEGEILSVREQNKDETVAYRKQVADAEVKSIADAEKAVYEERLTDAAEVPEDHPLAELIERAKAADTESTVATSRTARAESVQKRELNEAIQDEESGLAARMGGIDPEGENLVIAQAIEGNRKADETDIAAYAVRLRDQGVPDIVSGAQYDNDGNVIREAVISTPDRPSLLGIAMDTRRPSAEKEAAGRAIIEGGNIDAIGPYLDYLATERARAQQAVATVRAQITTEQSTAASEGRDPDPAVIQEAQTRLREATEQFENVQSLQKAAGEKIGSSPGKPMGLGAAEIALLKTGNYMPPTPTAALNGSGTELVDPTTGLRVPLSNLPNQRQALSELSPIELQTLSTVVTKGPSSDGWASMDKTDIRRILRLTRAGLIPPERLASMSETLQLSLHDDRWAGRIQDRERGLLTQLEAILPPPPARARTTGP